MIFNYTCQFYNFIYLHLVSDEYVVAPEMGPMYILKVPTSMDQPCDPKAVTIDAEKNIGLVCYGTQSSKNGFLWIVLQEGSMPQPKAKLMVMTTFDFQQLLKYPDIWTNDSVAQ